MSLVISKKNKLIFFHLPKNAGTAISDLLLRDENYYFSWVILSKFLRRFTRKDNFFYDNNLKKIHLLRSHESIKDIQKKISSEIFNNYFKFAVVRNPFSRFVSRFNYTKKILKNQDLNFDNFVREYIDYNMITDKQYKFLLNKKGEIGVNKILRFENIDQDLHNISKIVNINVTKFRKMNSSTHDEYKDYYSEDTKKIVENYCMEDLEYFNYHF